jgi:hypothetical protein
MPPEKAKGAYWRPSGRALNVQQTLPGLAPTIHVKRSFLVLLRHFFFAAIVSSQLLIPRFASANSAGRLAETPRRRDLPPELQQDIRSQSL